MSYEIVKSITFKKDGVYLRSCSNNVTPKYYYSQKNWYLSNILETQGRDAADIAILLAYEEGNFQPGVQNRYTRALDYLRSRAEYADYDWDQTEARQTDGFADLLHTSLYVN